MKKFLGTCTIYGYVLSLLTVKLYAVHSMLINGDTSATVATTDSFVLTADFEQPGVLAKGIVYLDANTNGELDPTDPWLYKIRLIDGGFDDEDETADTHYTQIFEPFKFAGKFLLYAEDNGVSDTVYLIVNSFSSPHYISGKLTTPANQPNILVCLIDIIDMATLKFEYKYGDFTDDTGGYFIGVPEEEANRWWNIAAIDPAILVPSYGSNDPVDDSIYVSGSVTKDLAMKSSLSDSSVVYGTLIDNTGSPITDPTVINGGAYVENVGRYLRPGKTDSTGAFRVKFPRAGSLRGYAYIVSASTATQFYPELMNAPQQQTSGLGPSPVSINLNLTAYRTDTTISGYVFKEAIPYDRCELECGAPNIGGTYTKTYSDGHYNMPVADTSQYTVNVAPKSIPYGYTVSPQDTTVAPGDTGVNFTLIIVRTEENHYSQFQIPKLELYPNPAIWEVVVKLHSSTDVGNLVLYNLAGKYITQIKPQTNEKGSRFILSKNLPTGIYFYSLKVGDRVCKGKIIKMR